LEHKASRKKVFFGNTHGPLSGCRRRKAKLGEHYLDGIASNSQPNDIVIVTGDWNCRAKTLAMKKVATKFTKQATGYPFPTHMALTMPAPAKLNTSYNARFLEEHASCEIYRKPYLME